MALCLLHSNGSGTSTVSDILNGKTAQGVLSTKDMVALRLVADSEIKCADLVEAERAGTVLDVVESRVLSDPGLGSAAGEETDGVGGHERKLLVGCLDEVLAVFHVDALVLNVHAAALDGVLGGALAGSQVDVGVIADVVGTAGSVDVKEVHFAAVGGDFDADTVATRELREVGDAVGIDVAAKDTDRGGVLVVGSDRDARSGGSGDEAKSGSNEGQHFVDCW